jgi:hypothetical protein
MVSVTIRKYHHGALGPEEDPRGSEKRSVWHGLCIAEQDCLRAHSCKLACRDEHTANRTQVSTCRNFYHANQLLVSALSSVSVLFGLSAVPSVV